MGSFRQLNNPDFALVLDEQLDIPMPMCGLPMAADVVLMDDDPLKIAKAIRISRKCLGIVYQNIVFAIGVKILCLALGAVGLANMWLAIFADVGVMILAVLNAIRALFVHNLGGTDYEISADPQCDDQAGIRRNDVSRRSVAG